MSSSRVWLALSLTLVLAGATTSLRAQEPGSFPPEPPPPLPGTEMEFPGFESFTLRNGLRVVLVSYGTQPVVSARLYLPGGSSAEPNELAGLASLSADVLTQGTTSRSAEEIAAGIEGVGGSLSASAGQDFLSISASSLTRHLDTAFELLADVVLNATIPVEEIELARTQMLSGLRAELGQPQAVAARRFASIVYGEEHPYGVGATPETVEAITREDVLAFLDAQLRPDGALLLVAGQIGRPRLESLVRIRLGGWAGEEVVGPSLPPPPERGATRIHLVHRPGSVQSVVSVGHLGISGDNPDYFPVLVLNRVLGGGPTSRLFRILREERGWTYGAYSQFTLPAERGHFVAQAEVRAEVTDSTVVEMLEQLRRIREEPVPQDELEGARSYLAGSFPLRLETASQVASQLAPTLLLGLPLEYVTEYPDRVRAVVTGDVRLAAREHLHPDRAAIVVVGDAARLLGPLEAIAPVELVDLNGEPMSRDDLEAARTPQPWDASLLRPGERSYQVVVEGDSVGSLEYRLAREGEDWRSTVTLGSLGSVQATDLRFSATDFTPRSVTQRTTQGGVSVSAEFGVEGDRLVGAVEMPEQLGEDRELDQPLPPGTLLAGMEEYALQAAELEEGARFAVPYVDLTTGELVELQVHVRGAEEVTVPAGAFSTWRTEVTGGDAPLTLFLRREPPHILVRQEYTGQPVRFDLTSVAGF